MAGFRHWAGLSRPRSGLHRFEYLDFPWAISISASRPGTLRRRTAFALLQPGCSHPTTLAGRPYRRTHCFWKLSLPVPVDRLKPPERRTAPRVEPRSPVCPFEPRQSKKLTVPLQPNATSVPYPGRRLLSETSAGPSRGRPPAFIESRSGLSHQPNISVRVCIPLERLAGG